LPPKSDTQAAFARLGQGKRAAFNQLGMNPTFNLVTLVTFLTLDALMRVFLKYWLPLLIWVGVMFLSSTDLMSAEHTSRFITPILLWLKPGMAPKTIAAIHVIIRKCAHLGEYAILALLLFRAVVSVVNAEWSMWILSLVVWIGCVFVATTDEFHQSFVKSRTASVEDVLIDSSGAFFGVFIGAVLAVRNSKKARRNLGEVVSARL
jgi:VanZ family protein